MLANGEKAPIKVPGESVEQAQDVIITETIIPDYISDGNFLCFRSSQQDMQVYIDGELRKEYIANDTSFVGRISTIIFLCAIVLLVTHAQTGLTVATIGASANVVGIATAGKEGYVIRWGRYCKLMVPATVIVMVISMVVIYARYL